MSSERVNQMIEAGMVSDGDTLYLGSLEIPVGDVDRYHPHKFLLVLDQVRTEKAYADAICNTEGMSDEGAKLFKAFGWK
jgi:hypothetical protein